MLNTLQSTYIGNGERVLIVDDSRETVRHLAENILPTFGYDSGWALDGQSALAKIRQDLPELVLLDLNMPGMNGIAVLEALSTDSYQPPIVLMTGTGSEQAAIDAFRLGARDYLVKPFTTEEVVETIRKTLDAAGNQPINGIPIAHSPIAHERSNFQRLLTVSTAITSATASPQIVDRALNCTGDMLAGDFVSLYLDETLLQTSAFWTRDGRTSTERMVDTFDNPIIEHVLASGDIVREADSAIGYDIGEKSAAQAILFVPITNNGCVAGVLGVARLNSARPFTAADEQLTAAIADYAAIALTNAKLIAAAQSG